MHVGVSILILKKTTSAISYLEGDGGGRRGGLLSPPLKTARRQNASLLLKRHAGHFASFSEAVQ